MNDRDDECDDALPVKVGPRQKTRCPATLEVESDQVGWPGTLVLVTIICYVGFYSTGVATIAWIGTELIPNEARALGTMLNTVT